MADRHHGLLSWYRHAAEQRNRELGVADSSYRLNIGLARKLRDHLRRAVSERLGGEYHIQSAIQIHELFFMFYNVGIV